MNKVRIYKAIFGVSVALLITSALFLIQHWPFGQELSIIALIAMAISSCLFYSSKLEKSFVDELAIVLVPLFCGFMLVRIAHLPYQLEIKIVLLAIAMLYSGYKGVKWQIADKANGAKGINLERNSYLLGIILIGIGLFLKYQHWSYSSAFLLSGMGVMALYYILPMFSSDDDQ
jgi:hypothetical protein